MATVTITLTDTPDDPTGDITVNVVSEPGFELGDGAASLTAAQGLAMMMLDAGRGKLVSATGTRRDDGLDETVQFFADNADDEE